MCTSFYGTQMVTLYERRITTHTAISVVTEPICPAKNISRLNSFFPSLCFFPRRGLGLDSSSGWRPRALSPASFFSYISVWSNAVSYVPADLGMQSSGPRLYDDVYYIIMKNRDL